MHPLDRPIWSALTSVHAGHARGDARARRYPAEIVPFAATRDDEAESLAALLPLVPAGDGVRMLQAEPIALPPGLVSRSSLEGVQLVAKAAFHASSTRASPRSPKAMLRRCWLWPP